MIVESIQRIFAVTPLYTEQQVYKTIVDPETLKTYTEIITWRVYDRKGHIQESYQSQLDIRA